MTEKHIIIFLVLFLLLELRLQGFFGIGTHDKEEDSDYY